MSAIDYATTLTSLDAAIATASGEDLALLQDVRNRLAKKGAELTARWSAEVDTAKTAWSAAASAAFTQAKEAADYVITTAGQPAPPAITFNTYSSAEIVGRLSAAEEFASGAVARALESYGSAFSRAWADTSEAPSLYTGARRNPSDPWAAPVAVAALEREIYALIAEATELLAMVAA